MDRNDAWIIPALWIAGATMACAVVLRALTGFPGHPEGYTSLKVAIAVVVVSALCRFLFHLLKLWRAGVPNPIERIRSDLRPALADFVPIAAGVAIIGAFLSSMSFLKSMIIAVVPFWADDPLARLDQMLWIDPQALGLALGPYLPTIGLFYGLWHVAHLGGILWVVHWRNGLKSRLIIAFMLTWAIGMFFAYVFSSAGPLFTGRYDLAIAPESVRRPAEMLWTNYTQKGALLGGGISAFPSLHVAIATWFGLVLRERGLAWLGIAYVLAVFACSIILGWHYAADGIGGTAIALLAFRLAGVLIDRPRQAAILVAQPASVPN
jgi:hypothetical protein